MPNYLTHEDVANYGPDLIDVAQRAALNVVAPHLQSLEQQNLELQRRLAQESRRHMDAAVERALPNYRQLDEDPGWHAWLRGIDSLSGRVRQTLLNEATASGDASRALAFFNSYFRNNPQQAASQSTQQPTARRQQPAVSGRIYTRPEIAQLYRKQAKGGFSEAEWARQESDICRASAEGRIVGGEPLGNGMLTK